MCDLILFAFAVTVAVAAIVELIHVASSYTSKDQNPRTLYLNLLTHTRGGRKMLLQRRRRKKNKKKHGKSG